jgi:hypothetical protein
LKAFQNNPDLKKAPQVGGAFDRQGYRMKKSFAVASFTVS